MNKTKFNIQSIRRDFPLISQQAAEGKQLAYLDNAATTQKPQQVLDVIEQYYSSQNANIHRGVHDLSQVATAEYEQSRENIRKFIHAKSIEEVIFVRGATEAINLVVSTMGRQCLRPGENVVVSHMEHHANFVPWQQLCKQTETELRVIPVTKRGELDMEKVSQLIDHRTRFLAIVHVSNTLGTVNPVGQLIEMAHQKGAYVLIDAAQSVSHIPIDVQELDCEFLVFSGHKLFGPTGIGVLYGKKALLESMEPYQLGGEMIRMVSVEETLFNRLPHKFEAGTPNIAGAIGLGAAIKYINNIGLDEIHAHIEQLLVYGTEQLGKVKGLRIIGEAEHKTSIISFLLDQIHPHDIGTIVNESGVAIRTGHHCTMPLMQYYKIPGTARASFSIYNTKDEIDQLVEALNRVKSIFSS